VFIEGRVSCHAFNALTRCECVKTIPLRNQASVGGAGKILRRRRNPMSNDFVPGNDLEEALVDAATNPALRADFYKRLVESDLLFLTNDSPDAPQVDEGEIEFLSWEGPRGPYVPCFSSVERLQEIAERPEDAGRVVQLGGRQAFELLAQLPCEAFLNPGLGYGKRFAPKEIRRLADGTIFEAVRRHSPEVPAHEPPARAAPPVTERTAPAAERKAPAADDPSFEPTIAESRLDARELFGEPVARPAPRPDLRETPRPQLFASAGGRPSPSPALTAPEPAPPPKRKPWWKFW
jgi:hypothetical protein